MLLGMHWPWGQKVNVSGLNNVPPSLVCGLIWLLWYCNLACFVLHFHFTAVVACCHWCDSLVSNWLYDSFATNFRCNATWKTVQRSQSSIAQGASTLDVHSVHLSFTRGTYVTCIYCHMLTKAWLAHCVIMESSGLIGRRWENIISRSMPSPCLIRYLHLALTYLIDSHRWG